VGIILEVRECRLVLVLSLRLLVLDPLISYHSKNENDNAEMRKTLDALTRLCEDTNAAVLVVHHAGKAGTGGGARGASAITDWASNIMSLDPIDPFHGNIRRDLAQKVPRYWVIFHRFVN
jgi:RecA-family ATPase